MAFDSPPNRRCFLGLMAGASLAALGRTRAAATEELIGRLIAQSREFLAISHRIDVISAGLLGRRYRANALIGGPRTQEIFVVRDDGFDCVTYCETALAAANAHDLPSFEASLRAIRYRNAQVEWRERNHDFAAWCERNVANGLCRTLTPGATVEIRKSITIPRELGRRNYSIAATPRSVLLAHKDALADGDIMGFVSLRPGLDYYHSGFVMFGPKGGLLLRHASLSHGRVVNERIEKFFAVNRVHYVTVLRPQDKAA
jgi:hypothetical protein